MEIAEERFKGHEIALQKLIKVIDGTGKRPFSVVFNGVIKAMLADIGSHQYPMPVIAVSGCSCIGKSTFCRRMKKFGQELGLEIAHVETDNWILDRETRGRLGLSHGYNLCGYYVDRMSKDLDSLIIRGKEIEVHPYDNSTGKLAIEPLIIEPSNIILLDGSISMLDIFVKRYGLR